MKINLGSSKLKKSFFPNDFDSSTTLNFGEVVPLFCKPVVADSNVDIDIRSAVRFAPLSLPTFGKAYLKNYTFYNRFDQLYPPYNNLLTQTPYTGTSDPYVPSKVPSIPLSLLYAIVLSNSFYTIYDLGTSLPIPTTGEVYSSGTYQFRFLSDVIVPSWSQEQEASILPTTLLMSSTLANYKFFDGSILRSSIEDYNQSYALTGDPFAGSCRYFGSDSLSRNDYFVEPSASDYVFVVKGSEIYFSDSDGGPQPIPTDGAISDDNYYAFCIRLTDSGKLLRKLFKGLGYQILDSSEEVSVLPLVAFYKNYFDTFFPKRFMQYTQTNMYRVMNVVCQENVGFLEAIISRSASGFSYSTVNLYDLITDLCNCYYTQDTNYYTAQIIGQINGFGAPLSQRYMGRDYGNNVLVETSTNAGNANGNAFVNLSNDDGSSSGSPLMHQQSQQNILSRLTEFLNVRSLVGGKIADTLESVYGIKKKEVLDEMGYVGSSSIDVEISDVFATTESADVTLGEYAGKALSYGNNGHYKIDCPVNGVIITFATIVPRTQYVDGVEPYLFNVDYVSQYNPKFDGLTLLPSRVMSFFAQDVINGFRTANSYNGSYGNIPIYSEFKTKTQGILNGDLSLKSTQNSYDSFTMDNVISDEPFLQTAVGNTGFNVTYRSVLPHALSTNINWRFLGRWLWNGRFDRIFVNNRSGDDISYDDSNTDMDLSRAVYRTDDNMICHNVVDMKINAPMLPLADSFMTKDLYELENGVGVRSQGE